MPNYYFSYIMDNDQEEESFLDLLVDLQKNPYKYLKNNDQHYITKILETNFFEDTYSLVVPEEYDEKHTQNLNEIASEYIKDTSIDIFIDLKYSMRFFKVSGGVLEKVHYIETFYPNGDYADIYFLF